MDLRVTQGRDEGESSGSPGVSAGLRRRCVLKLSLHLYNPKSKCLQFCALVWALGHWKVSKREIQGQIFY